MPKLLSPKGGGGTIVTASVELKKGRSGVQEQSTINFGELLNKAKTLGNDTEDDDFADLDKTLLAGNNQSLSSSQRGGGGSYRINALAEQAFRKIAERPEHLESSPFGLKSK